MDNVLPGNNNAIPEPYVPGLKNSFMALAHVLKALSRRAEETENFVEVLYKQRSRYNNSSETLATTLAQLYKKICLMS